MYTNEYNKAFFYSHYNYILKPVHSDTYMCTIQITPHYTTLTSIIRYLLNKDQLLYLNTTSEH